MLRRSKYLRATAVQMCVATLVSCCVYAGPNGGTSREFSGESIFRGLFFGSGPVAGMFPELWRDARRRTLQTLRERPDHVAALEAVERVVLQHITSHDAGFMDDFGAAMRSGDHLRIDAALKGASSAILRALEAEYGEDAVVKPGESIDPGQTCVAVTIFITVVSVIAVLAVATTAVAIHAVAAEVDVIAQELATPKAKLEYEIWVDRIATRLVVPTSR